MSSPLSGLSAPGLTCSPTLCCVLYKWGRRHWLAGEEYHATRALGASAVAKGLHNRNHKAAGSVIDSRYGLFRLG